MFGYWWPHPTLNENQRYRMNYHSIRIVYLLKLSPNILFFISFFSPFYSFNPLVKSDLIRHFLRYQYCNLVLLLCYCMGFICRPSQLVWDKKIWLSCLCSNCRTSKGGFSFWDGGNGIELRCAKLLWVLTRKTFFDKKQEQKGKRVFKVHEHQHKQKEFLFTHENINNYMVWGIIAYVQHNRRTKSNSFLFHVVIHMHNRVCQFWENN